MPLYTEGSGSLIRVCGAHMRGFCLMEDYASDQQLGSTLEFGPPFIYPSSVPLFRP